MYTDTASYLIFDDIPSPLHFPKKISGKKQIKIRRLPLVCEYIHSVIVHSRYIITQQPSKLCDKNLPLSGTRTIGLSRHLSRFCHYTVLVISSRRQLTRGPAVSPPSEEATAVAQSRVTRGCFQTVNLLSGATPRYLADFLVSGMILGICFLVSRSISVSEIAVCNPCSSIHSLIWRMTWFS